MPTPNLIEALGRWYAPTAERWYAHCEACASLGCPAEGFEVFVDDVLNTPEESRDWLLASEPIPESAPFVRFRQYESPRAEDMVAGLFYRDYRGGKK